MVVWKILTACTDVMDSIFGFFTGILTIVSSLAAINERIVLVFIDAFQNGLDNVLYFAEIFEKLFTIRISFECLHYYATEALWSILMNAAEFMKRHCVSISCLCCLLITGVIVYHFSSRLLLLCANNLLPDRARRWVRRYVRRGRIRLVNGNDYDSDDDDDDYDDGSSVHGREDFSEDESDGAADMNPYAHGQRHVNGSSNASSQTAIRNRGASSSSSEQENFNSSSRKESHKPLCVICQDQAKSVLVLPCRHLCLCLNCARIIYSTVDLPKVCPLCRTGIRKMINVFV